MSNEYKHSIQFDLDHLTQYEDVSDLEEKKAELDRVYEQTAKAQAFDRIRKHYNDCCYTNEVNGFPRIDETNFRKLIEGEFENVESGESDET